MVTRLQCSLPVGDVRTSRVKKSSACELAGNFTSVLESALDGLPATSMFQTQQKANATSYILFTCLFKSLNNAAYLLQGDGDPGI